MIPSFFTRTQSSRPSSASTLSHREPSFQPFWGTFNQYQSIVEWILVAHWAWVQCLGPVQDQGSSWNITSNSLGEEKLLRVCKGLVSSFPWADTPCLQSRCFAWHLGDNITVTLCFFRDMIKFVDHPSGLNHLSQAASTPYRSTACLGVWWKQWFPVLNTPNRVMPFFSLRHLWALARLFLPFTEGKREDPIIS